MPKKPKLISYTRIKQAFDEARAVAAGAKVDLSDAPKVAEALEKLPDHSLFGSFVNGALSARLARLGADMGARLREKQGSTPSAPSQNLIRSSEDLGKGPWRGASLDDLRETSSEPLAWAVGRGDPGDHEDDYTADEHAEEDENGPLSGLRKVTT